MLLHIVLLFCVLSLVIDAQNQPIYKDTVNGLKFGDVRFYTAFQGLRGVTPRKMEVDRHNTKRDHILFAFSRSLYVLDTFSWKVTLISGGNGSPEFADGIGTAARYSNILGFVQLNANEVLIADHQPSVCLRHLNRVTGQTSTFAGSCGNRGYVDGSFESARFNGLHDLVHSPSRNAQYTISTNNRGDVLIRVFDLTQRTVSTLINLRNAGFMGFARNIALDPSEQNIYVSSHSMLAKVNLDTKTYTALTPTVNTWGFKDGPLSSAKVSFPSEIIFLNDNTILLSDEQNQRLRVMDLKTSTISSICSPSNPSGSRGADGDIRSCTFAFSLEALLYRPERNQVLIGVNEGLRQLQLGEGEKPGSCPRYGFSFTKPCSHDYNCNGNEKCCPTGWTNFPQICMRPRF